MSIFERIIENMKCERLFENTIKYDIIKMYSRKEGKKMTNAERKKLNDYYNYQEEYFNNFGELP